MKEIRLEKVSVHNLKEIDLTLPMGKLILFTGVSGSGKSSMAFDTIYMEGQRRYIESLSHFQRNQAQEMRRPELKRADGITPTISIEQKSQNKNPRSTVGTMTEVADFLRVLFSRIGRAYCPISKELISPQSRDRICQTILQEPLGAELILLFPFVKGRKGEFKEDLALFLKKGFVRARIDNKMVRLDEEVALDKNLVHDIDIVYDRFQVSFENRSRIRDSVQNALEEGKGTLITLEGEKETLFSTHGFSPKSGLSYEALEPADFSFNTPSGMCELCQGLGKIEEFDLEKVIDPNLSIKEGACLIASSYDTVRFGNIYDNLAKLYNFSVSTPWKKLSSDAKKVFLYGTEKKWTKMVFVHPETGKSWIDHIQWRGALHEAKVRLHSAKSERYKEKMGEWLHEEICPACQGARLKPYPSHVKVGEKRLSEICQMTLVEAKGFFDALSFTGIEQEIAEELLKEIRARLGFLIDVGLDYLTLDREAPSLSGGESQRVRLASQIGSSLVGVTYILDEPSIGLHLRDNTRLIATLKNLRDKGNTVIVVEHDEETLWHADHIVDFGPLAGRSGGQIVASGKIQDILTAEASMTGAYLSGRLSIQRKKSPVKSDKILTLTGATYNNLDNVNLKLPLGLFVVITGVSGSGKSSLIMETLIPALQNRLDGPQRKTVAKGGAYKSISGVEHLDKVIMIDQSPIGQNPRSNPATYIKLFDEIRALFSKLSESSMKGFSKGRFSFNVKEGSCETCLGLGMITLNMDFLEERQILCPDCEGKRFDSETLSITYKGKNIHDILEMPCEEALHFFSEIASIRHKLELLVKVGLGYLSLGQPSTTLSGGEAQRIKLAKELVRPHTKKTLYVFDEPTTGLHFHDIAKLLTVFEELLEKGASIVVIEHNPDIIQAADWIIDLGPGGGKNGGEILLSAPYAKLLKASTPTATSLREHLRADFKKIESKPPSLEKEFTHIHIEEAKEHNLQSISASIPRHKITVCTGPSGSGKSSFAFDTLFAEGQRRFVETLSSYARQFVKEMSKPKVGRIEGLSPAIAVEQKVHAGNPRSTVGTITEIYDYLRLLYAHIGIPYDPETKAKLKRMTQELLFQELSSMDTGTKMEIYAKLSLRRQEKFEDLAKKLERNGFLRLRINGELYELENPIPFDRKRKNQILLLIDRLKWAPSESGRLQNSLSLAKEWGAGEIVLYIDGHQMSYSLESPKSGQKSLLSPALFAFNKREGMCENCQGLGVEYGANLRESPEITALSFTSLIRQLTPSFYESQGEAFLFQEAKKAGIDLTLAIDAVSEKGEKWIFDGSSTPFSSKPYLRWIGLNALFAKMGQKAKNDIRAGILPFLQERVCPTCQGSRLNKQARHVFIDDLTICDLCEKSVTEARLFIEGIVLGEELEHLKDVKSAILSRLAFVEDVGLGYLSLGRKAPTLSGGEAERLRLARQLGSGLTEVLYVLDEPTIGLHPKDIDRLNRTLIKLKEASNTLVLVEHDEGTVKIADHILDFGPKAGKSGGHIVARGSFQEILRNPESVTGPWLSKKKKMPTFAKRKLKFDLSLTKGSCHNIQDLSLKVPTNGLTVISGLSGSGKSTLLLDILKPLAESALKKGKESLELVSSPLGTLIGMAPFAKVSTIDQDPIGTTIRSDIATYTDLLTPFRQFFAALPEAKKMGLEPKHFSYNHRKGMCGKCFGIGFRRIDLHFLPPIHVTCDECHGLRLNQRSLQVRYQEKNLGQWLSMSVDLALPLLSHFRKINRILETLSQTGLGYLQLCQEIATLSGGEAQRLKLSRELAKRGGEKTLFLIDEPTRGLHPEDIAKLLPIFHKLVDKGHAVIVIEHNIDFIQGADWVVEIGPGPGVLGGKVIATGTPSSLKKNSASVTGPFL